MQSRDSSSSSYPFAFHPPASAAEKQLAYSLRNVSRVHRGSTGGGSGNFLLQQAQQPNQGLGAMSPATASRLACEAARRVRELVASVDVSLSAPDGDREAHECARVCIDEMIAENEKSRRGITPKLVSSDSKSTTSFVDASRQSSPRFPGASEDFPLPRAPIVSRGAGDGETGSDVSAETSSSALPGRSAVDLFSVDDGQLRRVMRRKQQQQRSNGPTPVPGTPNVSVGAEGGAPRFFGARSGEQSPGTSTMMGGTSPPTSSTNVNQKQAPSASSGVAAGGITSKRDEVDRLLDLTSSCQRLSEEMLSYLQRMAEISDEPRLSAKSSGNNNDAGGGGGGIAGKQLKGVIASAYDVMRVLYDTTTDVANRILGIEHELDQHEMSIGPLESMLRLAREELLFARQQRDEARRELMLHRVCARFRAMVRKGREMRGEEYTLVSTTQLLASPMAPTASGGGGGAGGNSTGNSTVMRSRDSKQLTVGFKDSNVSGGGGSGGGSEQAHLLGSTMGGNVYNPLVAVGGLTPALKLQGAAMARNAFRLVPPKRGASAADVEKAEAELTHCIANVDVILATIVHISISDYNVLWDAMPFAMKPAVTMFNDVVERVASMFDAGLLVYRSRGSVSFAPHGGYHMLLFRHPQDALQFSAMLHCTLLLVPWPEQLVNLSRDHPKPSGSTVGATSTTPGSQHLDTSFSPDSHSQSLSSPHPMGGGITYDSAMGQGSSFRTGAGYSTAPTKSIASSSPPRGSGAVRGVTNAGVVFMPSVLTAAGTVEVSADDMSAALPFSPSWSIGGGATSGAPPRSHLDMLIKNLEQFYIQNGSGSSPTALEFGDAISIAERLAAHVAIGPARVHELFSKPILFRGLRAKVGIHTGIVFIEGSIKEGKSCMMSASEETDPQDIAYSFRPGFGKATMNAGAPSEQNTRRSFSAAAGTDLGTSGPLGNNSDKQGQDIFYGTVNAKVPLVYGAAVMKASVLCGTASGGETVISQQTYSVCQGALDTWGLFSRPVNYMADSTLFPPTAPVVNNYMYSLFDVGEVSYQVLPARFLQRALFFPAGGAMGLYNTTWWVPFQPNYDVVRYLDLVDPAAVAAPLQSTVAWTTPLAAEVMRKRIQQLERRVASTKEAVVVAFKDARRGRTQSQLWEQNQMQSHDRCDVFHFVNLLAAELRGNETLLATSPVATIDAAVENLRKPNRLLAIHPGAKPMYSEQLLEDQSPVQEFCAAALQHHDALTALKLQEAVTQMSSNTISSMGNVSSSALRADFFKSAPWIFVVYGLVNHTLHLVEQLKSGGINNAQRVDKLARFATWLDTQVEALWAQDYGRTYSGLPMTMPSMFMVLLAARLVCQFSLMHCRRETTPRQEVYLHDRPNVQGWNAFIARSVSRASLRIGGCVDFCPEAEGEGGADVMSSSGHASRGSRSATMSPSSSTGSDPRQGSSSGRENVAGVKPNPLLDVSDTPDNGRVAAARGGEGGRDDDDDASALIPLIEQLESVRLLSSLTIPTHHWLDGHHTHRVLHYSELLDELLSSIASAVREGLTGNFMASNPGPRANNSVAAPTSSPAAVYGTTSKLLANLVDEKRFEHDRRLLSTSTLTDFRSTSAHEPRGVMEASTETMHHNTSGSTFIAFTVFCEEPAFPFAPLRDPTSNEDGLHVPLIVRRLAKAVVHDMHDLYETARASCKFFYPCVGTVDHEQRVSGSGAIAPTITLMYPDFTNKLGVLTTMSSLDQILASALQSHRQEGGGTGHSSAVVSPSHAAPTPTNMFASTPLQSWNISHVESWGLSLAASISALHDLNGASGFISPWSVLVPTDFRTGRIGETSYLLENSALWLWKLGVSKASGQDLVAQLSAAGQLKSTNNATDHHASPHSTDHVPRITPRQLVESFPPEYLQVLASLSDDGDNPLNYSSRFFASIVSGASQGTAQRGPFEEAIDIKAADVWMFGMLLWHLATGGLSPFTILRRNKAAAEASALSTLGFSEGGPAPHGNNHHAHNGNNQGSSHNYRAVATGLLAVLHHLPNDAANMTGGMTFAFPSLVPSKSTNPQFLKPEEASRGGGRRRSSAAASGSRGSPGSRRESSYDSFDAHGGATSQSMELGAGHASNAVTQFNMFGTIGNLMRNLRFCLQSKHAKLAPYHVDFLWPSGAALAASISVNNTNPNNNTTAAAGGDGDSEMPSLLFAVDACGPAHPLPSSGGGTVKQSGTNSAGNIDSAGSPSAHGMSDPLLHLAKDVDRHHCTSFVLLCDLLHKTLQINPANRITMREVLRHPFFSHVPTRVASSGSLEVMMPQYVGLVNTKKPDGPQTRNAAGGGGGGSRTGGSVPASLVGTPTHSHIGQQGSSSPFNVGTPLTSAPPGPTPSGHLMRDPTQRHQATSQQQMPKQCRMFGGVPLINLAAKHVLPLEHVTPSANADSPSSSSSNAPLLTDPLSYIVQEGGPLFQILRAEYSLGVPFITTPVDAKNCVRPAPLSAGAVIPNTPSNANSALMASTAFAVSEMSEHHGLALVALSHDPVALMRRDAAHEAIRQDAVSVSEHFATTNSVLPLLPELSGYMRSLLGLSDATASD